MAGEIDGARRPTRQGKRGRQAGEADRARVSGDWVVIRVGAIACLVVAVVQAFGQASPGVRASDTPVATPSPTPATSNPVPGSQAVNGRGGDDVTAVATLLGALLGFGGALLIERNSWKRRKAEQVRQEQLGKLLAAARFVHEAKERLDLCKREVGAARDSVRAPNHATLQAQASAEIGRTYAFLREKVSELGVAHLELRVLRVSDATLRTLSLSISSIAAAIEVLRPAVGGFGPVEEQAILRTEIVLDTLIVSALDGLLQG